MDHLLSRSTVNLDIRISIILFQSRTIALIREIENRQSYELAPVSTEKSAAAYKAMAE
jgi:hypothetical protein